MVDFDDSQKKLCFIGRSAKSFPEEIAKQYGPKAKHLDATDNKISYGDLLKERFSLLVDLCHS